MLRLIFFLMISTNLNAMQRIKDLAHISGIRNNQLIGYGLVVGLDGSGDGNAFTTQSFKTMLTKFGIRLPEGVTASSKNIAAVAISANLPPFSQPGQSIDITVSSIGDAKSLRGGTLLMSQLRGADNKVYAVAQGNLVVGGFGAEGKDGSKIKVNVPVVGRIPNGATIEVASPSTFLESGKITYLINRADFTTIKRMSEAINGHMGVGTAHPVDAVSLNVLVPSDHAKRVQFLSVLENIRLTPGEESAKVIVNSRTGTIVVGQHVKVGPAAVSHGSLTVTITETKTTTTNDDDEVIVEEQSDLSIAQEDGKMFLLSGVSLKKIVQAVNQVGASPGDLMAILEALKQAGALSADLEII